MKTAFSSWSREARLLPLFVPLMLAACSGSDSPTGAAGDASATLSVYLTDAPGDVSRVWVDVLGITGKGPGGLKVTLLDEPTGLIELTALEDDVMMLVEALEMAPGPLNQLRFIIGGAVLETEDGKIFVRGGAVHPAGLEATGELECPGCSTSGVKVSLSKDLSIEEGVNGLLLDFDVGQSFGKEAGNSGKWVMRPVLHGAKRNPANVGGEDDTFQIRGTVALADAVVIPACVGARSVDDFVPLATALTLVDEDGAPVVFSGVTKSQGTFKVKVLEADGYAMGFVEEIEFEGAKLVFVATADPPEVTVDEGMPPPEVAYEITLATCVEG